VSRIFWPSIRKANGMNEMGFTEGREGHEEAALSSRPLRPSVQTSPQTRDVRVNRLFWRTLRGREHRATIIQVALRRRMPRKTKIQPALPRRVPRATIIRATYREGAPEKQNPAHLTTEGEPENGGLRHRAVARLGIGSALSGAYSATRDFHRLGWRLP
jgi:hypothetical protein